MFKPFLKRSKLNEALQYNATVARSPLTHTNYFSAETIPQNSTSRKSASIRFPTSPIIPGRLLTPVEFAPSASRTHILTPLACTVVPYPQTIQEFLKHGQGQIESRSIGVWRDICWFYIDHKLFIWREGDYQCREFDCDGVIRSAAIQQLKNVSLQFKSNNVVVIALGVEYRLHLYQIQVQTLALKYLKMVYTLPDCNEIQRIIFPNQNSIIFAGNTGVVNCIQFGAEVKQIYLKKSIWAQIVGSSDKWEKSGIQRVEEIVSNGKWIYCLMNKVVENNWIVRTAKMAWNSIVAQSDPKSPYFTQYRSILVYSKVGTQIKHQYTLTQQSLTSKIRTLTLYPPAMRDAFRIQSIYLTKPSVQDEGYLTVVTRCGWMIGLRNDSDVHFQGQTVGLPKDIGKCGIFIQKKWKQDELDVKGGSIDRTNSVILSLGFKNLTLLQDCLMYYDQQQVALLKYPPVSTDLYVRKGLLPSSARSWALFSREGQHVITLPHHHHYLLAYLYYKCQVLKDQFDQEGLNQSDGEFWRVMEGVAQRVGEVGFCQMLIQILIRGEEQKFVVNQSFWQVMIKSELDGRPNKDFSDWAHSVSDLSPAKELKPTQQMLRAAWLLLLLHQSRAPSVQMSFEYSARVFPAYWFALQLTFAKIIEPVIKLDARNFKRDQNIIQETVKAMDAIFQMIKQKKAREQSGKWKARLRQIGMLKNTNLNFKNTDTSFMDLNQTMDMSIQSPQSQQFITQTCVRLEQLLITTIPKVKILLSLFFRLMQVKQDVQLPLFGTVLTNLQAQIKLRYFLIQQWKNYEDIKCIDKEVPELGLNRAISWQLWREAQKKMKSSLLQIDCNKMAQLITSKEIQQLKKIFQEYPDVLLQILLLYERSISQELSLLARRKTIFENTFLQSDILAKDSLDYAEQICQYLRNQLHAVSIACKKIISDTIEELVKKPRETYFVLEKRVNNMIEIVVQSNQPEMLQVMESSLREGELKEKLIALKKSQKRKETRSGTKMDLSLFQSILEPKMNDQTKKEYPSTFDTLLNGNIP